ncbi:hypothetical protein EDB85DRAFT_2295443 [Lactarius pseudohatsudake]|nr:hypothetical protein EDB85DRAFT_2295443 [Lactarius pseudohatsudake]
MRRLFQECRFAHGNAQLLSESLTYASPEDLREKDILKAGTRSTFGENVANNIPWATAGADRSRAAREAQQQQQLQQQRTIKRRNSPHRQNQKQGNGEDSPVEPTPEEQLLGALLEANGALTSVLRDYDDIERIGIERETLERSRQEVPFRSPLNVLDDRGYVSPLDIMPPSPRIVLTQALRPRRLLPRIHLPYPIPAVLQPHAGQPPPITPDPSPTGKLRINSTITCLAPSCTAWPSLTWPCFLRILPHHSLGRAEWRAREAFLWVSIVPAWDTKARTKTARKISAPPIRPSAKALGKRRVVEAEEPDPDAFNPDDLFYERTDVRDTRNPFGRNKPVHYAYDAVAERTQRLMQQMSLVNGGALSVVHDFLLTDPAAVVLVHYTTPFPSPSTCTKRMAKVEASDDSLYDGLYGEEFEEDFAVSTLDNPSNITDAVGDDAGAELLEPPEDDVTPATLEPEEAKPIPTLDSRPRLSNADALPPNQLLQAAVVTPSQERGRLDAARLAQFQVNQTGAPSSGSTGANSPTTDAQARPIRPSEMKDEGKMFVGGLSWDTTDEGLRNYFSEFGKVDACTIVRDADGKSRGFAFLTFEEPASVNAVMIREHFLDGKAIDPKRAIPREEHLRNTRYFVVDATVMVDRETGRSKGFGFVTFEDNSNDAQLVGKLGLILDDKQIEVKTAQPRSQRDQQRLGHAATTPTNNFNNGQVAAGNAAPMGSNMPFMSMNNPGAGDMSMMYQRMMSGMGNTPYGAMMGGGMGMMGGFNPMMGMGMGMGRFGMGGMGAMGNAGVGAMSPMASAGNMGGGANMGMAGGGVGGMRLGMGPIGMTGAGAGMGGMVPAGGGMGAAAGMQGAAAAMGGMGMGMRQNMGMMGGGVGRGRPGMNQGPGPARVTNRGQHGFHPYAR